MTLTGTFQSVLKAVAKPFDDLTGSLAEAVPEAITQPELTVPLPPRRPASLETAAVARMIAAPAAEVRVEAMAPQHQPGTANPERIILPSPGLPRMMAGAVPVVASGAFSASRPAAL